MNGLQITIITSTYNCEEDFCKTAESIKNQNYCNIQWIVIDGNSNKSTLEYIYRYIDIIDYFLCESDQGIYDAWNKALPHINGDWVIFMGAGDTFYENNTLSKIANAIHENMSATTIYGDVYFSDEDNIVGVYGKIKKKWECGRPSLPPHQGTFQHSSFFIDNANRFDTTLKIAADSDFMIRTIDPSTMHYVNFPVSIMDASGVSSNESNKKLVKKEIAYILAKNNIHMPLSYKIKFAVYNSLQVLFKVIVPQALYQKTKSIKRKLFGLR